MQAFDRGSPMKYLTNCSRLHVTAVGNIVRRAARGRRRQKTAAGLPLVAPRRAVIFLETGRRVRAERGGVSADQEKIAS
jgi:hypothetical protein